MTTNNDDTKKESFGITLKFSNNNRFYYGSMYDKDHIVETNEKVTVEKKVYESVLRNTLRVNELEEENAKLKELLKDCRNCVTRQIYGGPTGQIWEGVFDDKLLTKIDEALQ